MARKNEITGLEQELEKHEAELERLACVKASLEAELAANKEQQEQIRDMLYRIKLTFKRQKRKSANLWGAAAAFAAYRRQSETDQ